MIDPACIGCVSAVLLTLLSDCFCFPMPLQRVSQRAMNSQNYLRDGGTSNDLLSFFYRGAHPPRHFPSCRVQRGQNGGHSDVLGQGSGARRNSRMTNKRPALARRRCRPHRLERADGHWPRATPRRRFYEKKFRKTYVRGK